MASPIRDDLLLFLPSLPTFVSTLLTTATARSTITLELAKDTGPFDKPNKDGITSNGKVELKGLDTSESWQYRTSLTGPWLTGVGSSFVLGEGVYATGSIQVRTILADNQPSTEVFTYPSQITVDTTPPVALTLSLAQDTGSSATDFITNNGVVNVTGLEAGASWEYLIGTRVVKGSGTSFTLPVGTYAKGLIKVRQYDVAGNVQTTLSINEEITVDKTAPTGLAINTVAGDNVINASEVSSVITGIAKPLRFQYHPSFVLTSLAPLTNLLYEVPSTKTSIEAVSCVVTNWKL